MYLGEGIAPPQIRASADSNFPSEGHRNTWLKFAPAWWRGLAPALMRLSMRGCNLNFGPVANQPLDERTILGSRPETKLDSCRVSIPLAQMVRFVPQSSSPPRYSRREPSRGSRFDRNSRIEDTGCAKVTDLGSPYTCSPLRRSRIFFDDILKSSISCLFSRDQSDAITRQTINAF